VSFRSAWRFLYEHELTHFRSDLLVTGIEFASEKALFLPARRLPIRTPGRGESEEALATLVGRSALPLELRTSLDWWLDSCPPGYRDWRSASLTDGWSSVVGEATAGVLLPMFWGPRAGSRPIYEREVPLFLIIDTDIDPELLAASFVGPIANITETDQFRADLDTLARGRPRVHAAWEKRKRMLKEGSLAGGSHLEQIDGARSLYSVRIDSSNRAGLKHDRTKSTWSAIAADAHDRLYARLRGGDF
jgi:hypothetical protein